MIPNVSLVHFTDRRDPMPGAPNEDIVQNHLNIALLNASYYLNGS